MTARTMRRSTTRSFWTACPLSRMARRQSCATSFDNVNRTVGARLSGEIAHRYGDAGLDRRHDRHQLRGQRGAKFRCVLHPWRASQSSGARPTTMWARGWAAVR